jgi:hypothetical protein
MLNIQTFDARAGGNVLYKALAHPLAAEALAGLFITLASAEHLAIYDPEGITEALFALYPHAPRPAALFVHDVERVGQTFAGLIAKPLTALPDSGATAVLVTAFDAARVIDRIQHLLPAGAEALSLDSVRVPGELLTNHRRYLDKLNFANNFAFFRDDGRLSTRLVTANYWGRYGAGGVRLWLRLFAADGSVLASWEQDAPEGAIQLDSAEIRARFRLPPFTGQLFIHAIGVAGHDIVKYALDTYASDGGPSLSCTHDANAWPSDRYAGLPAPREDERVVLWVQNSHATPIPVGGLALDQMGAEAPVPYPHEIGAFASVPLDVATLLPNLRWPSQIELRAGRHMVRPRYEITRAERVRIAHVNVERADLKPEPAIAALPPALGRGFVLPFPILPRDRFRSIVQPTPMAETQTTLPLRLDVFDRDGTLVSERFLGCLPRRFDLACEIEDVEEGHAELVYDFRDGGGADGWMHALVRYEDRASGHVAESSFGAHIFNTVMTWRDEPQSYSGSPPGLSTGLFLKLGEARRHSFAILIYAASAPWHKSSDTKLVLHDGKRRAVAEVSVKIACRGSATVWPHKLFSATDIKAAGPNAYVMVRDATCRLFGYHGLMDQRGGFSLDHMFGF